jgi:hypothetical protein
LGKALLVSCAGFAFLVTVGVLLNHHCSIQVRFRVHEVLVDDKPGPDAGEENSHWAVWYSPEILSVLVCLVLDEIQRRAVVHLLVELLR